MSKAEAVRTAEPAGTPAAAGQAVATALHQELDDLLADADARLRAQYPGDPSTRQPVHTVYVPADRFSAETPARWGAEARRLLEQFAPDAATLAAATGLPADDVAEAHPRVLAKLAAEPVEDLRVDFEDGFGQRGDAVEDGCVSETLAAFLELGRVGTRPPFFGIRFKSFEGPTRRRGVATLAAVVAGLTGTGTTDGRPELPDGFVVTLPKVTSVDQVRAMVHACHRLEGELGLAPGSLRFEVQVETAQAVLGADGTATVARLVHAAEGRCVGLHYGTFDYSAGLGIAAAQQSLEHPAADHAKAVMQVAAAQTGVQLSDGSTNVVAFDTTAQAHRTWALHSRLVTRALQRGYYQGWDMHPGHLPSRYLATYVFFRAAMLPAAERLRAYASARQGEQSAAAVLDEPATAKALATTLLRGLRCGAVDEDEVREVSGQDATALLELAGARPVMDAGR